MRRAVCAFETEPCADCTPIRLVDRWLHSDGCPVAVNLLRDVAADRLWFAQHPDTDEHNRPLTWAESVIVRRALIALSRTTDEHDLDLEWGLVTCVSRSHDGHIRQFVGVALVLSDSSGEQVLMPGRVWVLDGEAAINVLAGRFHRTVA